MNQTALHLVESVIPHVPVRQWVKRLQGGAVTSIQRAGSALQSTLHYHTVALDGVYLVPDDSDESSEPLRFLAAPVLSDIEVQSVAWNTSKAVMKMLQKRGVELTGGDDAAGTPSPQCSTRWGCAPRVGRWSRTAARPCSR